MNWRKRMGVDWRRRVGVDWRRRVGMDRRGRVGMKWRRRVGVDWRRVGMDWRRRMRWRQRWRDGLVVRYRGEVTINAGTRAVWEWRVAPWKRRRRSSTASTMVNRRVGHDCSRERAYLLPSQLVRYCRQRNAVTKLDPL